MTWPVRPCASRDEVRIALSAIFHYFGRTEPRPEQLEAFTHILPTDRMLAAWDGEQIVGGAGVFPLLLTIPGGRVPAAGVTVVGVLPTHRRRGVLSAMMRAQLDDCRRRGEPLAALWASEDVIYGRFGYGLASLTGEIAIPRDRSSYAAPFEPFGATRLVPPGEAEKLVAPIWETVAAKTPGMFARSSGWWQARALADPEWQRGGGDLRCVVLDADDAPAAYALYRMNDRWDRGVSMGSIDVREAIGVSPAATRAIWRYLLDMDLVSSLKAWFLPVDHPLFLLMAEPRRLHFTMRDGVWVRLIDVATALSRPQLCGAGRGRAGADRRLLSLERRTLAHQRQGRRADAERPRSPGRRHRSGLRLPGRLLVAPARRRLPGGGIAPGRARSGRCALPDRSRPVVPGAILKAVDQPSTPIAAVTHANPYPYYATLVAERPLYRDDALGLWVAASAAAVRAVMTSDLCRVRPAAEPVPKALVGSPAGAIFGQLVRMTDGGTHLRAKLGVSGHLASLDSAKIADHSVACARRLAEELQPARDAERLADFAFRLPTYIVASVLGFPSEQLPQLADWTLDFVGCLAPTATAERLEDGKVAAARLVEAFVAHTGRAELDSLVANRIGYLSQACEATAGLIGNTLLALGRYPDVLARVTTDRAFLVAVAREVVRHDAPVQNTRRFVAESGTIAGQAMREGDTVLVVLAAANRDPAANADGERFDPLRKERQAFTFSLGAHACPGETLATLITVAGVEQLLASGVHPERLARGVSYRPSANLRIPRFTA